MLDLAYLKELSIVVIAWSMIVALWVVLIGVVIAMYKALKD